MSDCFTPIRTLATTLTAIGAILWTLSGSTLLRADDGPADPDPMRFSDAIDAFEEADQTKAPEPGSILFLGSSSIGRWDLDTSFPDQHVLNRGFGGSQTSDVIFFADRVVAPYQPRLVVVYVGDNDIAGGKSADRVHDDFLRLVDQIRTHAPGASTLYLAIKPSLARRQLWPEMQKANGLIAASCDEYEDLTFIDIATPMFNAEGDMRPELYVSDGLHLSAEGYDVWARTLAPALTPSPEGPASP